MPLTRSSNRTASVDKPIPKLSTGAAHTAGAKRTSVISRLPPEMLGMILSYASIKVVKPGHLCNVCLVSKHMRAAATPLLYRTTQLTACDLNEALLAKFNTKNPGLRHVRNLIIRDPFADFKRKVHGRFLIALLKAIPKNSLRTFAFRTLHEVSLEFQNLLLSRQRHLSVFNSFSPPPQCSLSIAIPAAADLNNISTLCLYLATKKDCIRASALLERAVNMSALSIYIGSTLRTGPGGVHDKPSLDTLKLVFKNFWRDLPMSGKDTLKVKRLSIDHIDFGLCAYTVAAMLDPSILEEIKLFWVLNSAPFIQALADTGTKLRALTNAVTWDEGRSNGGLIKLRSSYSGLEHLHLSCASGNFTEQCTWDSISQHGSTLKTLLIDDVEPGLPGFRFEVNKKRKLPAFRAMLEKCPLLQQLAIRAPPLEHCLWKDDAGFSELLDALQSLSSLNALRLITYPYELSDMVRRTDSAVAEVQEQALGATSEAFRVLHECCPKLTTIVIDAREFDESILHYFSQFAYLRVLQKDLYGVCSYAAVAWPVDDIKYHEPHSDLMVDEHDFNGFELAAR